MKERHPTTLTTIIITLIWVCSFAMFILDIEIFFLTWLVVFSLGVAISAADPESARKKITLKFFAIYLTIVSLIIATFIGLFKFAPQLLEPPPQPYPIISMGVLYCLCFLFLWRKWFKARQKKT